MFCRLLGTLCSQMYQYFRRYPMDRTFYKALVSARRIIVWISH